MACDNVVVSAHCSDKTCDLCSKQTMSCHLSCGLTQSSAPVLDRRSPLTWAWQSNHVISRPLPFTQSHPRPNHLDALMGPGGKGQRGARKQRPGTLKASGRQGRKD